MRQVTSKIGKRWRCQHAAKIHFRTITPNLLASMREQDKGLHGRLLSES
jgi:hypothetical protein